MCSEGIINPVTISTTRKCILDEILYIPLLLVLPDKRILFKYTLKYKIGMDK